MAIWFLLCFLGSKDPVVLYQGKVPHQLTTINQGGLPYVSLYDFSIGLGMQMRIDAQGLIRVNVSNRQVVLDAEANSADLGWRTMSANVLKMGETPYVRVDSLVSVFSEIMGKDMIYEPTSRTIHIRVVENQILALKGVWLQDHYQLRLSFAHPPNGLTVNRSARKLVMRLKTAQIDIDDAEFEENEVVENVDLFENLPDGSSEIHIRLGPSVLRYQIQPYSDDRSQMVVDLYGGFEIPEFYADGFEQEKDYVGLRKIVLDPGHGGKDQGARGPTGLVEKDVTLDICRKLKRYLELSGEYEVILTRNGDFSLPLKVRTGVANNARADLFVSIHLNAIMRPDAWGSETYYLSLDETDAQSMTIEFENRDLTDPLLDEDSTEMELEDPDLEMMLWDLAQTEFVEDSFRFAKYVQEELNLLAGIRNRGVKQGPLKVLKGATMPAVLVEIAFISNPDEERKLRDYRFKQRTVRSIGRAITRYDADVRKRLGKLPQTVDGQPALEGGRH